MVLDELFLSLYEGTTVKDPKTGKEKKPVFTLSFLRDSQLTEYRQRAASYEEKYGSYRDAILPHITAVETVIDLYPETRSVHITGKYELVNRSDKAIRLLPVTTKPRVFRGDILPFGGTININSIYFHSSTCPRDNPITQK